MNRERRRSARNAPASRGRKFIAISILGWAAGCAAPEFAAPHPTGFAFEEAEPLFHRDPRWLGADAALSIPLGEERTLWLFGDSFIATSDAHTRRESRMVRNSVAIQTGDDPLTASIEFHWRLDAEGAPASLFPEREEHWYWPGHGIRLDEGPLLLFLYTLRATPGQGLGFAHAGYAVAVIGDPDAPAATWDPRIIDAPPSAFDAVPATAVLRDGEHLVAVAIRQEGTHAGALVRFPIASLALGDTGQAQWWAGEERGWVGETELGAGGPTFVIDDAGAECSLHRDPRTGRFLHIASYGFGATTIGLRTAPALTGPWSAPVTVYRPPESDGPRPFVYAAKAHPELIGPREQDLVVTYATNSFDFGDLFGDRGALDLYWPRFVVIRPTEHP
jgi:hypothetical protein